MQDFQQIFVSSQLKFLILEKKLLWFSFYVLDVIFKSIILLNPFEMN